MGVNYTNAVKTARMTATRDHFANGTLEILDVNGTTVIATFGLSAGGGTISTDTWTLTFDSTTVAASNGGVATTARIKTSGSTADLTGLTVSESSGDIIIDNTDINAGQNVTINSATIQHAA